MLRWAIIFLVISLVAGGLGLANLSTATRTISFILFAVFFVGFLLLIGVAYLVFELTDGVSLGTDYLYVAAR